MRLAVSLAVLAVLALMCAAEANAAPTPDQRLRALYEHEWKWREEQFADNENDTKPIVDHLPKVDPASQAARLVYWEQVMAELNAIPRDRLSPAEQENYDVYKPQIAALISNQKFRGFEMPVNSDTTFWTDLGYTARRPFRQLADYKNWIAQMRDIPRYFREQMDEMRAGLKRGFTPPRVTLEGRDASLTAVTDASPEKSLFYTPFENMTGITPSDQATLRAEAVAVIRDQVQPAYRQMLTFMHTEYVPNARTALAAEAMPDGKAWYRAQILEYTTLEMDPVEIHKLGLTEVATIHKQMVDAMHETGFKGDFAAFLKFLRSDPQFYAKTADELLMRAAWVAKKFDGKASTYFGYLPRKRFAIVPVPPDLAPFYTSGRGGPGQYLLNTYKLETRPLYNLTALTLHESAPGHAFQMPIAEERTDMPAFRRYTYISAFGEGWALYCEKLGLEMGMYDTPYDKFGMDGYQIWRAVRLVVDTGIHSQGWTREQAIQYMRENTALPEHEIETEVDRYIAWPGQALSYYLGEMAIWEARHKAEVALGSRFNIRAFHDTVLHLGSVPIPVLKARIDRFIADGGRGPYPDME